MKGLKEKVEGIIQSYKNQKRNIRTSLIFYEDFSDKNKTKEFYQQEEG